MTDLSLLRPLWLIAIAPALLLIWLAWRRADAASRWRGECDPQLLPYLLHNAGGRGSVLAPVYASLLAVLTILALAGPSWQRMDASGYRSLGARVVVLDLSNSMLAPDLSPSRLQRAKDKVRDILTRSRPSLSRGFNAIVVYAGAAFVVSPLTDDSNTLAEMLPALVPDIMPVQGSRLDLGISRAARLLREGGATYGDIIVLSDGPDAAQALDTKVLEAVQALDHSRITLSVLGVGTPAGAPVPLSTGGFLRNNNGNVVLARLNEPLLVQIAQRGGGVYQRIREDAADIDQILALHDAALARSDYRAIEQTIPSRYDQGIYLLPILLFLALAAFRRGWIMSLTVLTLLVPGQEAYALDWQSWFKQNQEPAAAAVTRGDYAAVLKLPDVDEWHAVAAYRLGDFDNAIKGFATVPGARGAYNLGNSLARAGRLREALQAYELAVTIEPGHEDARFNQALVRRALTAREDRAEQGNSAQQRQSNNNENNQPQDAERSSMPSSAQPERRADRPRSEAGFDSGSDTRQKPSTPDTEPTQAEPTPGRSDNDAPEKGIDSSERSFLEQWLERIPDEPGGLLKQKFRREYRRRHNHTPGQDQGTSW